MLFGKKPIGNDLSQQKVFFQRSLLLHSFLTLFGPSFLLFLTFIFADVVWKDCSQHKVHWIPCESGSVWRGQRLHSLLYRPRWQVLSPSLLSLSSLVFFLFFSLFCLKFISFSVYDPVLISVSLIHLCRKSIRNKRCISNSFVFACWILFVKSENNQKIILRIQIHRKHCIPLYLTCVWIQECLSSGSLCSLRNVMRCKNKFQIEVQEDPIVEEHQMISHDRSFLQIQTAKNRMNFSKKKTNLKIVNDGWQLLISHFYGIFWGVLKTTRLTFEISCDEHKIQFQKHSNFHQTWS